MKNQNNLMMMKKILGTMLATIIVSVPFFAMAEDMTTSPTFDNPIKANTFSEFVATVTKTAVEILMPFVVLAFIWSGFLFVKAQGNEKELEEAKKAIWWSIIGAFILMGAWGFATIIGDTMSAITPP